MARYLLPCTCGQQIEVEAKQAGLQVSCRCGKSLEVPTLRGMKQLTPVSPSQAEASAPASTWGPRQGITFLGVVVLLCGLLGVAVLFATRPVFNTPDLAEFEKESRESALKLSLEESFKAWEAVEKQGLNKSLNPYVRNYQERSAAYSRWLIASGILAGLGGVMAGAALASGKRPARRG
jgi:hypothetical protein